MRQLRWTTEAVDQLVATVERIREDNPAAAENVAQAVIDNIEKLLRFPAMGRSAEAQDWK